MELSPIEYTIMESPFYQLENHVDSKYEGNRLVDVLNAIFAFLDEDVKDFICMAALFVVIKQYMQFKDESLKKDYDEINSRYVRLSLNRFMGLNETYKYISELYKDKNKVKSEDHFKYINTNRTTSNFTIVTSTNTATTGFTLFDDVTRYYANPSVIYNQTVGNANTIIINPSTYISTMNVYGYYNTPISHMHLFRRIMQDSIELKDVFSPPKEQRQILKRQVKLLSQFIPSDDVKAFLNGKSIELTSERTQLTYRFTLKYNTLTIKDLNRGNHYATPYNLEIYNPDKKKIANLCVYIKDTPMLDQMSAMIMFIRSGEESILLEKANYYSIKDYESLKNVSERYGIKKMKQYGPPDRVISNYVVRGNIESGSNTLYIRESFESSGVYLRYKDMVKDRTLLKQVSQLTM